MPRRAADPQEALFRAFERVPRPGPLDACPCCLSRQEERAALATVPLRDLPRPAIAALAGYLWHATQPVGGADPLAAHVRYFTPRLLADAVGPDWIFPPLPLLARRIVIAGWAGWPRAQRTAVTGFLDATWEKLLRTDAGKPDAGAVLSAYGELETDIAPLLARWTAALPHPAAARRLQRLLTQVTYRDGQLGTWLETLWEPVAQAWLQSPSAEAREALEDLEIYLFPGR